MTSVQNIFRAAITIEPEGILYPAWHFLVLNESCNSHTIRETGPWTNHNDSEYADSVILCIGWVGGMIKNKNVVDDKSLPFVIQGSREALHCRKSDSERG
jgi:hypothetical protein